MDLTKLNKQQKDAVLYKDGPLLILAGAGSGKTRVLTYKVAYLIEEGTSPFSILAITFTNKASKEMKERIYSLVGDQANNIQISTFHSFGYKIIRQNFKLLNLNNNFTILDESDTISVVKKILKELNLDPKQYNPKAIKNQICSAKNELLTPDLYTKYVKTDWDEIVLKVYKKYQEALLNNNSVDFDDLLMLPIILFKKHPDVLNDYQEKYKYILIDEYQDTNEAQYKLTKMISSKYQNICVVGDNDQSIYSFRGANYNNILNFEKDYPNTKTILLEENYRSTKTILKAANNIIKNNKLRKDKNLWTDNQEGNKINYYRANDEKDEAHYIINEVKKLSKEGIPYDEMAILYRTNAQSRALEESFLVENIPYKVVGAYAFYNRKEIKDLVAYLKLIYNDQDDVSLLRCINNPKRGIGDKTIDDLIAKANVNHITIYEAIDSGKELAFKKIIEELKALSETSSLTELVDLILIKTGLKKSLDAEHTLEADIRLENLDEFKSITRGFEERYGVISLEEFLVEISLVSNSEDLKEGNNEKVSLMTTHAVKGLEFEVIFIVGLEEGILPHNNSLESNSELEEERRLFYVAVTRAKKHLYFINARMRLLFGERRINGESRFINEVGCECLESLNKKEEPTVIIKNDNLYTEEIEYNVGDKVKHDIFGKGVVVAIDKSIMSIAFSFPHGVKKLIKNHKSITKI
ncbi:MAG: UvrD-helicase domain-containing protein [Bacilli bacterium]|nr:UvrD-helicase domain-containing protein [Bacilli bacterium]